MTKINMNKLTMVAGGVNPFEEIENVFVPNEDPYSILPGAKDPKTGHHSNERDHLEELVIKSQDLYPTSCPAF